MVLNHNVRLIPDPFVGYRLRPVSASDPYDQERDAALFYAQHQLIPHLAGLDPQPFEKSKHYLDYMVG